MDSGDRYKLLLPWSRKAVSHTGSLSMFTICGPQDDLLKRVPVVTDLIDLMAATQILSNPPGQHQPRSRYVFPSE
jgi:hypothetical protein